MTRATPPSPTILFRADGSANIGVGHLVRCSTLARELVAAGASVHLAVRPGDRLPSWPIERFPGVTHELGAVTDPMPDDGPPLAHGDWLSTTQRDDARQVVDLVHDSIGVSTVDWIVVDHYGLDARWHREIRSVSHRVLAIDDLADRELEVDRLLDQNRTPELASADYASYIGSDVPIMAGPKWALLRQEFVDGRTAGRPPQGDPVRVLVLMGGSDPRGLTSMVMESLAAISRSLEITAVVGDPTQAQRVRSASNSMTHPLDLRVAERDMAALMARADVAISAAGSTVWELCCMGVPMALIAEEPNQAAVVEQAVRTGAALQVPTPVPRDIRATFDTMLGEPGRLQAMSKAGQSLVDGHGARRVSEAMLTA